jgi:hypothetical protein
MKRTPLARASVTRREHLAEPGRESFTAPRFGRCSICNKPGLLRRHHVVLEQHCRAEGADPWDVRNSLWIGDGRTCHCHRKHHDAVARIPVSKIPDEAIGFAVELYGSGAGAYLSRYYGAD